MVVVATGRFFVRELKGGEDEPGTELVSWA